MGLWDTVKDGAKAVGDAVSSAASSAGDAVEKTVKTVADTAEDAVDTVVDGVQDGLRSASEWVCKNDGDVGCAVANVVLGAVDGLLEGVQDLVHDVLEIVRDLGAIAGSILSLDLPGLLEDLGRLGVDLGDLALDAARFATGGYVVGGVADHFRRSRLLAFVEELVAREFGDDPETHRRVRREVGLEGRRFGFRLPAEHRVFVLDSADVELWAMHQQGVLDLYAMAGLTSFDSFSPGGPHPNALVRVVGDGGGDRFWPVTRLDVSRYLATRGEEVRLRVYAMDRRTTAEMLETASRKLEEIGVILQWNDGERFSWFRDYTRYPARREDYDFEVGDLPSLLDRSDPGRPAGENCRLLALACFRLDHFGYAAGRDIDECGNFPASCPTPGRTDRCCSTVLSGARSGVIYRDAYPTDALQYVLPHEIGHYLGLCHCGHDGFQHVMFSNEANDFWDVGILDFYWNNEPRFTLEDGENAWRFLVDQLRPCLTGEEEAEEELRTIRQANRPESCAVPYEVRGAGEELEEREGKAPEGEFVEA